MKLASLRYQGKEKAGMLVPGGILPLELLNRKFDWTYPDDLLRLIETGSLETIRVGMPEKNPSLSSPPPPPPPLLPRGHDPAPRRHPLHRDPGRGGDPGRRPGGVPDRRLRNPDEPGQRPKKSLNFSTPCCSANGGSKNSGIWGRTWPAHKGRPLPRSPDEENPPSCAIDAITGNSFSGRRLNGHLPTGKDQNPGVAFQGSCQYLRPLDA